MEINMDANFLKDFGMIAVLGFSAMGSALGCGTAGVSAVSAWKKCYVQNKPAPFLLLSFAGCPLSQTIYGFLVMTIKLSRPDVSPGFCLAAGILGGIAIGLSAWLQGIVCATACDSFAETGKGFANDLVVLGISETVALFTMVFILIS